jgi:hypothetical protein
MNIGLLLRSQPRILGWMASTLPLDYCWRLPCPLVCISLEIWFSSYAYYRERPKHHRGIRNPPLLTRHILWRRWLKWNIKEHLQQILQIPTSKSKLCCYVSQFMASQIQDIINIPGISAGSQRQQINEEILRSTTPLPPRCTNSMLVGWLASGLENVPFFRSPKCHIVVTRIQRKCSASVLRATRAYFVHSPVFLCGNGKWTHHYTGRVKNPALLVCPIPERILVIMHY